MTWRLGVPVGFLLLAGCFGADDEGLDYFPNVGVYEASPDQARVDRSFSDMPIETPFAEVQTRLTEIPIDRCKEWGECFWRDANGVQHYFFDELLVVKRVDARDFSERPIPALWIAGARGREEVLAAARRFLPGTEFECSEEGEEDGDEHCGAMLSPGWVSIRFDGNGQLTNVQLDGYHFT